MRQSTNETKDGAVFNGFDYELQVWVRGGLVQDCGHPNLVGCCNARRLAGKAVVTIPGHQVAA